VNNCYFRNANCTSRRIYIYIYIFFSTKKAIIGGRIVVEKYRFAIVGEKNNSSRDTSPRIGASKNTRGENRSFTVEIILQCARAVSCRAAVRKIIIPRDISWKAEERKRERRKIVGGQIDLSMLCRDYFAWRARYQLRARNVAGIRIRPAPFELPARGRSTSYDQPAVATGGCETRNDSTPREIVSTRAIRANRFLFSVSRQELAARELGGTSFWFRKNASRDKACISGK